MKLRKLSLMLLPLFLCGCSGTQLLSRPAPDFDRTYEVSAEIDYGNYSAAADITRNGKGEWQFCFSEPSYLMGVQMSLSDGTLTASLGELSVTAESNGAYALIPDVISAALDKLPDVPSENISENEGVLTITTDVLGEKAVVTADSSGSLLSLKCPAQQLSVKFSAQQEIDVTQTAETFEFIIE